MRMLSVLAIPATIMASTILSITPASAEERAKETFKHEGYTYVYAVKEAKEGRVISGRRYPGGASFSLVVSGDKVRGVSSGFPVSFSVEEARGATGSAKVVSSAVVQVGN